MSAQDFFSDLFNVGGQVVNLASSIAGMVGSQDSAGDTPSYSLGDLSFVADSNKMLVTNSSTAGTPYLWTLCNTAQTGLASLATSDVISIPADGAQYDITSQINDYQAGGSFTIVPQNTDSDTLGQAISFAIKSLSVGATISMVGGLSATFGQNTNGMWTMAISSTSPNPITGGSASVTGLNGISAKADIQLGTPPPNSGNTANDGSIVAYAMFPSGLLLSPTIPSVDIELVIPSDSIKFTQLKPFRKA